MPGHGEKLSRMQDKAVGALLTCDSLTQAALQCGVNEATLRRWLAVPLYWLMTSIAAWQAVLELRSKPFVWNKTPHQPSTRKI